MNNKFLTAILLLLSTQLAFADADVPELKFRESKIAQDVFAVKSPGEATYSVVDMPYLDWKAKSSGQFLPMEVAPVYRGKATGGVRLPEPKVIEAGKWEDQALEFIEAVNLRNKGGRQAIDPVEGKTPLSPEAQVAAEEKGTYVVQSVLSTVINRPVTQMKLTTEGFSDLTKKIDEDHFHFTIPGSLAIEALEKDHIAARSINLNQAYLLSVIDFRTYECQSMKNNLNDYFGRRSEKQRLYKESIYMISDLQVNAANDIASIQQYLGKRPDMVLAQTILYADHLVRGGRTLFAFFAEGNQTRVVLISNLALRGKFFVGGFEAKLARPVIMGGMGGKAGGVAADVVTAAFNAGNDGGKALLSKVTMDIMKKNRCNSGLALGLIKYSQMMFSRFADAMAK